MANRFNQIPRGVWACKGLFVALCLVLALDGRHPPARGQSTAPGSADVYGLEIRSAVQQSRMDQIEVRQAEMAARMSKQWDAINTNTAEISGFQGETRGIAGLLVLLQIGSMIFSKRMSKST